jgi:hypothetical protein
MRRAAQLLLVFLLSAVVTVGIASLLGVRVGGLGERLGAGADGGPPATELPDTVAQLRQRQDEYLGILLDNPTDAVAMRWLVAVRRRLAGDDPVVLRRQATAYQQLITSGAESPEHYSRKSMEVLASASLRAAAAVEAEQRNTAQRATRATGPVPAPGSSPPPKGAITPPALPSTPAQPDKVNPQVSAPAQPAPSKPPVPAPSAPPSQTGPGQAAAPSTPPPPTAPPGAPPSPQQPTGQPAAPSLPPTAPPSTTPAPQTPPAPPAGSTTPQPPPAGQSGSPPGSPEGIIAVVPPQTAGPELTQSEGSLAKVDCQKKTFVLHGSNGDEEYLTAPNLTIYIRGARSERLSDFCGLQQHIGQAAMVWSVSDGSRKIVKSMSVVLPAQ